uniref:ribosomal protein S16 n=1 Tax=Campylaephora boydenii TaxID=202204 RepID=UPI002551FA58|nr:ribosomal protein S16 [Campylaephora boydenii]WGT74190.1 ribosomal protein S16 [Campylaephora boydenii]
MLKIRLKRLGRKKQASYRIIVIDSKKRRDGKAIEEVGFYNPLTKETKINIESIQNRVKQGAQLTLTVKYLLNKKLNNKKEKI